jgi:hypothetical protein
VKSGRTSPSKGGSGRPKLSTGVRETLWIALSAQSMRMAEIVRLARGLARVVRDFEKRLEKLERAVKHQTIILDELPDVVRDEIGSRPRKS